MILVEKYGFRAPLRQFLFGYGRVVGVHNPMSSKLSKLADPFINTGTLVRLSNAPYQDSPIDIHAQLKRRIESETITPDQLKRANNAFVHGAFLKADTKTISIAYIGSGVIPRQVLIDIVLNGNAQHINRLQSLERIASSLSYSEANQMASELFKTGNADLIRTLLRSDKLSRHNLLRMLQNNIDTFSRIPDLTTAEINLIYPFWKAHLPVVQQIVKHPNTPHAVLFEIAKTYGSGRDYDAVSSQAVERMGGALSDAEFQTLAARCNARTIRIQLAMHEKAPLIFMKDVLRSTPDISLFDKLAGLLEYDDLHKLFYGHDALHLSADILRRIGEHPKADALLKIACEENIVRLEAASKHAEYRQRFFA